MIQRYMQSKDEEIMSLGEASKYSNVPDIEDADDDLDLSGGESQAVDTDGFIEECVAKGRDLNWE